MRLYTTNDVKIQAMWGEDPSTAVAGAPGIGSTVQPPACQADTPIDCNMVNLADDIRTGTLVGTTGDPIPVVVNGGINNPVPATFWEPDNLRGRALAGFLTCWAWR